MDMKIIDLINRCESLRKETVSGSISPERIGSIISDTLCFIKDSRENPATEEDVNNLLNSLN